MSRARRNQPPDTLSAVVALGKELSSGHDPLEHLLAYCRAAGSLCPRLRRVHAAFFAPGARSPVRVLLFDGEAWPGRVLCLGPADLSTAEKASLGAFSLRAASRRPAAGRRDRAAAEAAAAWVDALFKASAPPAAAPAGEPDGPRPMRAKGAARGAINVEGPLRLAVPGGPEAWVFLSGEGGSVPWEGSERDAVGLCTDMLAASLDRARLFASVLRAKKEWERSMDAIRDVVMIVGPDWRVLRGNRRLSDLAGVPVEALYGDRCYRLLASRKGPCPNCPAETTFRTGAEHTGEVPRPPGDALVQAWSYPLPDPAGGPDAAVVYEKDVTEIKRMQAKLVQAEKMAALGELAAAVAHELNNPLSGVISFSKILLTEMDPALPHAEDVKNIEHAALRCKKIVQDLLSFARKPASVTHDPVPVRAVVEEVLCLLRPRLEEKALSASVSVRPNLPDLPFHPDLLHRILLNLVVNAADASEPGGEISVRAAAETRGGVPRVVISVRDRGPGIPGPVRARLFEPFFTTKGPGEGTGLGLAICRKLMDAFGGEIQVSSSRAGGTTVSLRFPLPGCAG